MSDEKIIMDKGDYHEILNIIGYIKNYDENQLIYKIEENIIEIETLLDKAEPYDIKQRIKVYTTVFPAKPMTVQNTLIVGKEEPKIFIDRLLFDAEIKRRGINLTDIEYYHDKSKGDE